MPEEDPFEVHPADGFVRVIINAPQELKRCSTGELLSILKGVADLRTPSWQSDRPAIFIDLLTTNPPDVSMIELAVSRVFARRRSESTAWKQL